MLSALKNYNYDDAPEGKDPLGKIVGTVKYAFPMSVTAGLYDVCLLSQTSTFWSTLNCMSFWVVPITSMALVGPASIYLSARLRGKDDAWNYCAGAVAIAPIHHHWLKGGGLHTFSLTLVGFLFAYVCKDLLNRNGIIPRPVRGPRYLMVHNYN